jgi:hypothetical protein
MEFKNYPIFKKRDGQHFKEVSYIYATSFDEAKKEFALNMTKDNWEKSNNIFWLNKENDGVKESGWYDFNGGSPTFNQETEQYDADEAKNCLLVSEDDINEGFDTWNEDVYTWELREPLDFEEIIDVDDFENKKENFEFFMAYENYRFFLYNGDFSKIADELNLGTYNPNYDNFMGSKIDDDEEFILNCLS